MVKPLVGFDPALANKDIILLVEAMGAKWFPHVPGRTERGERAKAFMHRLDMSGTLTGFLRQHGIIQVGATKAPMSARSESASQTRQIRAWT